MTIICVACKEGTEIEESMYPEHMATVHGGSQLASLHAQKNVPKTQPGTLPPGINPGDLPDPTFLETVAEIEKEAAKPVSKPQVKIPEGPPTLPVAEKKLTPLSLEYRYTGTDKEGHEVETLEIDKGDKHYVIAYCMQCKKQQKSRQLLDLNKE